MWLPSGPFDRRDFDRHLLHRRFAMVCGSNCVVHDSRQFPEDGIRMCCSWRKAAVSRSPRTTGHTHYDLRPDRCLRLFDTVLEVHTDACSVRCLPVHGFLVPERFSDV